MQNGKNGKMCKSEDLDLKILNFYGMRPDGTGTVLT